MPIKVLFPFRFTNLKEVLEDPDNNPKEFLYGADKLLKNDVDYYLEPRGQRNTRFKRILLLFERPFSKRTKLGLPHEIVLCHRKEIRSAGKIVCINDAISFACLFWKYMGLVKADLITLFQSLPERHNRYFRKRPFINFFIRVLLAKANKVLVLSSAAKTELNKLFGVPLHKIEVFKFGADLSYWKYKTYEKDKREFILSVGNDLNRDYETLIKACSGKYRLVIVSKKLYKEKHFIVSPGLKEKVKKRFKKFLLIAVRCGHFGDAEILANLSNEELKQLYHTARLVVTPSCKLLTESSGLSTTVQAMACGTPVLISDSLPMRELFKENEQVFYFEPENICNLQKKIELIWNDNKLLEKVSAEARKLLEKDLNTDKMSEQLEQILAD